MSTPKPPDDLFPRSGGGPCILTTNAAFASAGGSGSARTECFTTEPDVAGLHREHESRTTVGQRLPHEMARVACDIMPVYALLPEGAPALELMKAALRRAAHATARQDVVEMLHAYHELRDFAL